MSMVEAVALAVIDELTDRKGFRQWWDNVDPQTQRDVGECVARAAIEALRVPSEAMIEADVWDEAADMAWLSHLLPPDGGDPTEGERLVAENLSERFRSKAAALRGEDGPPPCHCGCTSSSPGPSHYSNCTCG
jgi:hypothetical protein